MWENNEADQRKVNDIDAPYLIKTFKDNNIKIFDKTIDSDFDRGKGIKTWLNKHNDITGYVVLDDIEFNDFDKYGVTKHLVLTDSADEEMHIAYQPTIIFPAREGKHVTVHYNPKNHDEIVSTMLIKFMVPVTALMLLFFVNDIKKQDEKPIKAKGINDIYYANVFVYHLLCDIKYIHTDSIKA